MISQKTLDAWKAEFAALSVGKPASKEALDAAEAQFGRLGDLRSLLALANGLSLGLFRVLPAEDRGNLKQTWDGLARNSRYCRHGEDFVLIAQIGRDEYGYLRRSDSTVWFDDGDSAISMVSGGLVTFIEACLRDSMLG